MTQIYKDLSKVIKEFCADQLGVVKCEVRRVNENWQTRKESGEELYEVDCDYADKLPLVVVTADDADAGCYTIQFEYSLDICEICKGEGCDECNEKGYI